MTKSRTTLAELQELPAEEVARLPVGHLQLLVEDVATLMVRAKSLEDKVKTAIDLRFAEQAKAARIVAGKDTGRVRLEEDAFEILADSPKAVSWHQGELIKIATTIRDVWKQDPTDYLIIKYTVPESKYTAWPPALQKLFEPARTVKAGKPSYEIVAKRKEAA